MSNKKIIAVIGSTGSQGGSVVDIFLNDPLTIGKGDLNNKLSLVKAFTGATAVFGVTNYWESMSTDTEIQQGKNIVDAAKARIEEYAREGGVPSSFFLPGMYLQSVVDFFRQNEGAWVFAVPMPESAPIPIFDVRDTGIWVKAIVLKKDQLLGKRVLGSTRYTTPLEVVDAFKTAFPEAGEKAGFYSLPHDAFLQGVKESMGAPDWVAEEVLENMRLVAEGGYFAFEPLDDSHAALVGDKPTSLIDFLRGHKSFKDLK
uniref:NmrA-like domain-containing protein n=1 Tax=Fusarium oxysporum (strain Fo5176) TaxID=660025 RepID=A0A0D2YJQ8_FUSOF